MEIPQIHTITYSELHQYALESFGLAYQCLPNRNAVDFVPLADDDFDRIPPRANVANSRLIIGYRKASIPCKRNAVYMYMFRRDPYLKVSIELDSKSLDIPSLCDIQFIEPFNRVYKIHGMHIRTFDKICSLAGFYFLAKGEVSILRTRFNFRKAFHKACKAIYESEVYKSQEPGSDDGANGEYLVFSRVLDRSNHGIYNNKSNRTDALCYRRRDPTRRPIRGQYNHRVYYSHCRDKRTAKQGTCEL